VFLCKALSVSAN